MKNEWWGRVGSVGARETHKNLTFYSFLFFSFFFCITGTLQDMVQKTIMDKLGLTRDEGNPDSDQINARKISDKLHTKKFLLLLDDIWQKLGHSLVGILLPNDRNQSKLQSSICNVINRRL